MTHFRAQVREVINRNTIVRLSRTLSAACEPYRFASIATVNAEATGG